MTWPWRLVNGLIIGIFLLQIAYSLFQLGVVLQPPGTVGPLFGDAATLEHDLLMARRLYAIELWIAAGALAAYLGITEILPRRLGRPGDP